MNTRAHVCVRSSDGRTQKVACRIVGETPKHYRIECDCVVALPPGYSLLMPGMSRLVPKRSVTVLVEEDYDDGEGEDKCANWKPLGGEDDHQPSCG